MVQSASAAGCTGTGRPCPDCGPRCHSANLVTAHCAVADGGTVLFAKQACTVGICAQPGSTGVVIAAKLKRFESDLEARQTDAVFNMSSNAEVLRSVMMLSGN